MSYNFPRICFLRLPPVFWRSYHMSSRMSPQNLWLALMICIIYPNRSGTLSGSLSALTLIYAAKHWAQTFISMVSRQHSWEFCSLSSENSHMSESMSLHLYEIFFSYLVDQLCQYWGQGFSQQDTLPTPGGLSSSVLLPSSAPNWCRRLPRWVPLYCPDSGLPLCHWV